MASFGTVRGLNGTKVSVQAGTSLVSIDLTDEHGNVTGVGMTGEDAHRLARYLTSASASVPDEFWNYGAPGGRVPE